MKIMRKNREQGQSLIEFAMSLPLLILILSGLLDLGRAYYTYVALEEAVAEAALYLAISPDCYDNVNQFGAPLADKCQDPNNAIYRAANAGNGDEFDVDEAEWNIPFTADKASAGWKNPFPQSCSTIGCNVLVQVEYPFEVLTPGIQAFVNNTAGTITLRTQAAQIIVFEQQ